MKWVGILFYSVIDLALAGVLAFLAPYDHGFVVFSVTMLVLWILPLANGIFNTIKFWLWFHLGLKRSLVRAAKADFHLHKFPPSSSFYDFEEYFKANMGDTTASDTVRLRSAFLMGQLSALKAERPMTGAFATSLAYAQAIDEYKP